jgi:hypothetical protein
MTDRDKSARALNIAISQAVRPILAGVEPPDGSDLGRPAAFRIR